MRGNRHQQNQPYQRLRSIPAYAGEPISERFGKPAGQVYPRVCGGTYANWNK